MSQAKKDDKNSVKKNVKTENAAAVTAEAFAPAASDDSPTDVDAVMKKYDRESNVRIWEGVPRIIITVLTAVFSVYCIYMTLFSKAMPEVRLPRFLGFIIIIGFLYFPISKKHVRPNSMPVYDIILMVLGSASFLYYSFNAEEIMLIKLKDFPLVFVIMGIVGLLVLVELCRRCVGLPIIFVAGALMIYTFVKLMTDNSTFIMGISLSENLSTVLSKMSHDLFYTTSGVIGTPISVCYSFIVLFIIFGAFLERTGIANFFISFANRIAGWASGGPAKVAVISSALCGMVSGSSVGNTVTTGSVTIPMMKKTGYKAEFAGAVEASASTGGQIMPPIMGAAAFLMAEYTGLPYATVAVKAILPAVLYFTGIFITVHLEAKKLGLKGISKEELPKWISLISNIYLMTPLVLLVVLVSTGSKTMGWAAAASIVVAAIIGGVNFFVNGLSGRKKGEPVKQIVTDSFKKTGFAVFDSLQAGGKGSVTVAVACAMAGIIAGCITMTGLANTLINSIVNVAGAIGSVSFFGISINFGVFFGLFLTMLCCIVLGMGVPTTANYCIMAATCAPILTSPEIGISPIAAHFFVFYFGIVADITPPVALAAFAGSAIAKANPMKTGFNATKLAIAAFVVPYIFALDPTMLFVFPDGISTGAKVLSVITISLSSIVGLFSLASGINGHLFRKINPGFRILLIIGGLLMMIPGTATDISGLAILVIVGVVQFIIFKKEKPGRAQNSKLTA